MNGRAWSLTPFGQVYVIAWCLAAVAIDSWLTSTLWLTAMALNWSVGHGREDLTEEVGQHERIV